MGLGPYAYYTNTVFLLAAVNHSANLWVSCWIINYIYTFQNITSVDVKNIFCSFGNAFNLIQTFCMNFALKRKKHGLKNRSKKSAFIKSNVPLASALILGFISCCLLKIHITHWNTKKVQEFPWAWRETVTEIPFPNEIMPEEKRMRTLE